MADLANIGFRADTSELKDAKASLEQLGPAAQSAEKASEQLAKAMDSAAGAAARGSAQNTASAKAAYEAASAHAASARAAYDAAKAEDARASAALKSLQAIEGTSRAELQAAAATKSNTAAALAAARALDIEAGAAARVAANENNAAIAAAKAAAANQNLKTSANALSGQVGNISAQFGDIAVQLAGGQSPFQIALQQGTQLVGIFGNSGLGAVVRGLGAAFMSLLSPLNLLTIGIIAVSGYAIQYFSSLINDGNAANLSLDDQLKLITSIQQSWGEAVPAINAYVEAAQAAKDAADAAAASQILTADATKDTTAQVNRLNVEYASFYQTLNDAGAKPEILYELPSVFSDLREKVVAGTATQEDFNKVLNLVNDASIQGINGVSSFIEALNSLMAAALKTTGVVSNMNATIAQSSNAALNNPAFWRGVGVESQDPMSGPLGGTSTDPNLPWDGPRPQSRPLIELEGMPWVHESKKGGGGGGSGTKQQVTELQELNQALQALNEPFQQASTAYNTLQTAMKNGVVDNDEYKASLEAIQQAFLDAGGTSDQWAQIVSQNGKKVASSLDEAKGILKGFVSDFTSGIRQGKSIWESFADAANNALNKIIDKMLNNLIDAIFTVNKAASGGSAAGGSGGGLFGGILSWFTGLFSAKGNVFDGGVQAFAKGGSFTNSVVGRPTAFSYGNGSLGVMGEAGPEAVMPLVRGPDGSLGVQNHGGGGGSNQNNVTIAPVINVEGGSSGNAEQDQQHAVKISDAVTDAIRAIVNDEILANTAYGGVLSPRGYSKS